MVNFATQGFEVWVEGEDEIIIVFIKYICSFTIYDGYVLLG